MNYPRVTVNPVGENIINDFGNPYVHSKKGTTVIKSFHVMRQLEEGALIEVAPEIAKEEATDGK